MFRFATTGGPGVMVLVLASATLGCSTLALKLPKSLRGGSASRADDKTGAADHGGARGEAAAPARTAAAPARGTLPADAPAGVPQKKYEDATYHVARLEKSLAEDRDYAAQMEQRLGVARAAVAELAVDYPDADLSALHQYMGALDAEARGVLLALTVEKQAEREPGLSREQQIAAVHGAPAIEPLAPAACDGPFKISELPAPGYYRDIMNAPTQEESLHNIAAWSCRAPELAARHKWVANLWQGVANEAGLDGAAFAKHQRTLLYLTDKGFDAKMNAYCEQITAPLKRSKGKEVAMSLAERAEATSHAVVMGCLERYARNGIWPDAIDDALEQGLTGPEQLWRGALLYEKLYVLDAQELQDERKRQDEALRMVAQVAHLSTDVERFDPRAFQKQARKSLPETKDPQVLAYRDWRLDFVSSAAQAQPARLEAALQEVDRDHPGVYKVAVTAPRAAFKKWERSFKRDKTALALVRTVQAAKQDGQVGKAKGCTKGARRLLLQRMKGAKDRDDVKARAQDFTVRPIVDATVDCARLDGESYDAALLKPLTYGDKAALGPRAAAMLGARDAVIPYLEKDEKFPIKAGYFKDILSGNDVAREFQKQQQKSGFRDLSFTAQDGVVQSMKKTKGGVKVTFKQTFITQPKYSCKETNRIDRIMPDGTIKYRENCKRIGTEKLRSSPLPVVFPPHLTTGMKRGSFVKFDRVQGGDSGVPVEVYKDENMKKMTAFRGVAVKN